MIRLRKEFWNFINEFNVIITNMKYLLIVSIFLVNIQGLFSQGLSADEIIKKADDKNRGLSSQGTLTMTVIRPDWTRTITMNSWSKGKDYSMVIITAPAKDKGQVFLKIKTEMWNWVPSIDKTIKLPPSMMLQSWMGSDFTNDDLVKQSSLVVDYTHKLIGAEKVRDQECISWNLFHYPTLLLYGGRLLFG